MIETLKEIDTRLFLYLNSKHSAFFDVVMYWASDKLFWLPFYLFLLVLLILDYKKRSIVILFSIAILITISDQLASGFIKNAVKRLRPSHEAALQKFIHLSSAGAGGEFGFVSSHASNSFALFLFLTLTLPRSFRPLKYVLFFWAVLVAYSRIYNGVHYPGDVIGGSLLGMLLAWIVARIYFYVSARWLL